MKTLDEINIGQKFRIKKYAGCGVKMKMECLVNPEKIIEVVSKQLFYGPIMLKVEDYQFSIGRGMARKIYVEEYKK
jgi:Fe2+ transport system protein FeoA